MSRTEPADTRLTCAMQCTVRVNTGSGVVLRRTASHVPVIATAGHVVGDGPEALVRWAGGARTVQVLAKDSEVDLAFTAVPDELEHLGLQVGDSSVADEVWLLGFPTGWEASVPLVSRGVIAGSAGNATWIDGAATWGNSGGPIVSLCDEPLLIGIVVGAASRVHRQLESLITLAEDESKLVDDLIDKRADNNSADPALGIAGYTTTRLVQVLDLVRLHFRPGFLEAVPAARIDILRGG